MPRDTIRETYIKEKIRRLLGYFNQDNKRDRKDHTFESVSSEPRTGSSVSVLHSLDLTFDSELRSGELVLTRQKLISDF